MGRTNKLVDGCYSFWQGALFPLLQRLTPQLLAQTGVPQHSHPWPSASSPANAAPAGDHADEVSAVADSIRDSSLETAAHAAGTRVQIPRLPELAVRSPAAAAAARAVALKAAADAAVQAALAVQLAPGHGEAAASGWQQRELASGRVRQLADTAGAALEVQSSSLEQRWCTDSSGCAAQLPHLYMFAHNHSLKHRKMCEYQQWSFIVQKGDC